MKKEFLLQDLWETIDHIEDNEEYLFVIHLHQLDSKGIIGVDVLDWETEEDLMEGGWFKKEEILDYILQFS